MDKRQLQFKCSGEFITDYLRSTFWEGTKRYEEVEKLGIKLLNTPNVEVSEEEKKKLVEELIWGNKALEGISPEIIVVEDDYTNFLTVIANTSKLQHLEQQLQEKDEVIEELQNVIESLKEIITKWEKFGETITNKADPIYNLRVALSKGVLDSITFYKKIFHNPSEDIKKRFNEFCEEFKIYPGIGQYGDWQWIEFFDKDTDVALSKEDFIRRGIAIVEEEKSIQSENMDSGSEDIKEVPEEKLGWLSPWGEFYETPWGEHEGQAYEVIQKYNWKEEYQEWKKTNEVGLLSLLARDFLVYVKGWVLIDNPLLFGGRIKTTYKMEKLTKKQREFLYDYFIQLGDSLQANQFYKEE